MQIVRTVFWVVLTAALVAFISINWNAAPVNLWPIGGGYLHFEWPVGVIALVFFLLGLLPMWLFAKAGKWRLKRRIGTLENSVRANAAPPPPLATANQLEGASPRHAPERSPESTQY
jgi:putative membrane protein